MALRSIAPEAPLNIDSVADALLVSGSIDSDNSERFGAMLAESGHPRMIDLSRVEFFDSAALAALEVWLANQPPPRPTIVSSRAVQLVLDALGMSNFADASR